MQKGSSFRLPELPYSIPGYFKNEETQPTIDERTTIQQPHQRVPHSPHGSVMGQAWDLSHPMAAPEEGVSYLLYFSNVG